MKNGIQAAQVPSVKHSLIEHFWISIRLRGSDQLLVGCVYRSPSADPRQSLEELAVLLHTVTASNTPHLLICGDFNLLQIDWHISFCSAPPSHSARSFLNVVQDCLLVQCVTEQTRYREGVLPTCLDLVFTNKEGMFSKLRYLPGLGKGDCIILKFHLNCYTARLSTHDRRQNFDRANFMQLREMLSEVKWQHLSSLSLEAGYTFSKESLARVISVCVSASRGSSSRKICI